MHASFSSRQTSRMQLSFPILLLFRNGDEVHRSEPEPIDLTGVGDFRKILLKKRMYLENTMEPGNYMLQLIVKDKKGGKNGDLAAQTLDFDILAK
jgi:hypothetical protein